MGAGWFCKSSACKARVKNAGANLAIVRRLVPNLFRLDTSRKGGIPIRRILAASSDAYRESLLGLSLL